MLAMKHRRAVTSEVQDRYIKATKKTKTMILDEFCTTTGYNRVYAARILRLKVGKVIGYSRVGGKKIKYVIGKKKKTKRKRDKIYGYDVFLKLKKIWVIFDFICGKRLAPFMEEAVEKLEKHKEIDLTSEVRPGFVEIDLVGHDGGNTSGDYIQSLNFVDIATCWDITAACINKAQVHVFKALRAISARFPFMILGIDSDNGSEFINAHLLRYCAENEITFTRSRPYRKNDSCFVEQKNYSVVRRAVGYSRYDTEEELSLLNKLYIYLDHYTNYFQPVVKLVSKTRTGSKVTKKYDRAKTPFRRVLESEFIDDKIKVRLKVKYDSLNPVDLKRKITKLQDKLTKLAVLKNKVRKDAVVYEEAYGYITG